MRQAFLLALLAVAMCGSIACDTLRRSEGTEPKTSIAREDKAIEIGEAVAPKSLLDRIHIIRPGENLFRIGIRLRRPVDHIGEAQRPYRSGCHAHRPRN